MPTSDTMTDTAGMTVERMLCRKTYTTRITRMMASTNVFTTSWMEASRNSLVLITSTSSSPLGNSWRTSSISWSISVIISLAFEPAVCDIMAVAPGCPSISLL